MPVFLLPCSIEEVGNLVYLRPGLFIVRDGGRVYIVGDIVAQFPPAYSLPQRSMQDPMEVYDRLSRQPFIELRRVEALHIVGTELRQSEASQSGSEVDADKLLVPLPGPRSDGVLAPL